MADRAIPSRFGRGGWFLLPAVLAATVSASTLSNGFVYDDVWTLDLIPTSLADLVKVFPQTRSLTYTVHFVDRLLWHHRAAGYHLTNILLHALATALAAFLAQRLSRSNRTALLCGCLFAVHPVHVETVASFAYRKDILAMIFVALSLYFWMRGRSIRHTVASGGCYALALLSKEVAALCLPLLFIPLDLIRARDETAPLIRRLAPTARRLFPHAVLVAAAMVRYGPEIVRQFDPRAILVITEYRLTSYPEVAANAFAAGPQLLRLLFFPVKLCADYDVRPALRLGDPAVLAGAALLAAWLLAAAATWRRLPWVSFGLLWTVIMFVPLSNILPLARNSVAERYLYVPSFGLCLAAGVLLDRLLARLRSPGPAWLRALATGAIVLLLAAGAWRSVRRASDWRDDYTLWTSAERAGFTSYRIHNNLGTALIERGERDAALREFQEAVRINPAAPDGEFNLGLAYADRGEIEPAIRALRAALSMNPRHVGAHTCLARCLALQGDFAGAVQEYRRALQDQPEHLPALSGLAWLLARCPQPEIRDGRESVRLAEAALRAAGAPRPEILLTLAWAWAECDDAGKAMEFTQAAEELARRQGAAALLPSIEEASRTFAGRSAAAGAPHGSAGTGSPHAPDGGAGLPPGSRAP